MIEIREQVKKLILNLTEAYEFTKAAYKSCMTHVKQHKKIVPSIETY